MQNHDNSRRCTKVLLVPAKSEQGFGSTGKHKIVKKFLIFIDQIIQFKRNCEDGMIIRTSFNEFRIAGHDPFLLLWGLTAWTVPIVAGTGMDFYMSAGFTVTDVITKGTCFTF